VFTILPAAAAFVTRTMVAELPAGIVPIVHVTGPVPEHDPWLGLVETRVTPAGKVSVTVTPEADDGPRFVALSMYVMLSPT
jgi:hypothetical protein